MKRTIFFTTAILGVLLPVVALAANLEVNLEVGYPFAGGYGPGGGPVQWVRWIFFFALGLVGVAAVGSLIYAGIVWMTSTSEDKTKDAKQRIWSALLGVLLVVGSVLILRTINPDLTRLQNPVLDPSIFQQPETGPPPETGTAGGECNASKLCPRSSLACDESTNTCRIREGFSCDPTNDQCEGGTTCNATSKKCEAPPDPGAPPGTLNGECRSTGPKCDPGLACNGSLCKVKVCTGPPTACPKCNNTSECQLGTCNEYKSTSGAVVNICQL